MSASRIPKNRQARQSKLGKSNANMVAALASVKMDANGKDIYRLPKNNEDWPEVKSNLLAHAGKEEFNIILTGDYEDIEDLDPAGAPYDFAVIRDHRKQVEKRTTVINAA